MRYISAVFGSFLLITLMILFAAFRFNRTDDIEPSVKHNYLVKIEFSQPNEVQKDIKAHANSPFDVICDFPGYPPSPPYRDLETCIYPWPKMPEPFPQVEAKCGKACELSKERLKRDIDFQILPAIRDDGPNHHYRLTPEFPKKAEKSGSCTVSVNVGVEGTAIDISEIKCTDDIFKAPTVKSVMRSKYVRKVQEGKPIAYTINDMRWRYH